MLFLRVPFLLPRPTQTRTPAKNNNNEKLKQIKKWIKRETYNLFVLGGGGRGCRWKSHWSKRIWQVRLVLHYRGENKWHQKANADETLWFLVVILDHAINNNVTHFVKMPDDCFTTVTINVYKPSHNFWIALACGCLLWEQNFSG